MKINGTTTFSITTFSKMKLSIEGIHVTLSITMLWYYAVWHYAECDYAECCYAKRCFAEYHIAECHYA